MSTPWPVVLCDDEPLAREALRDLIARDERLLLVGEAADGAQALKLLRALKPRLVFMDIQMPELTGLEVVRQLTGTTPWPAIVFTTAYDQHAVTAFELHAVDYLLKPFSGERFAAAVERVLASDAAAPAAQAEQALATRADAPLSGTVPEALRFQRRLGARAHVELAVDLLHVVGDGVAAQAQLHADLGQRVALGHAQQHLALAVGEVHVGQQVALLACGLALALK
jgi:DNA-binding LytR/AlgR family response regulator